MIKLTQHNSKCERIVSLLNCCCCFEKREILKHSVGNCITLFFIKQHFYYESHGKPFVKPTSTSTGSISISLTKVVCTGSISISLTKVVCTGSMSISLTKVVCTGFN